MKSNDKCFADFSSVVNNNSKLKTDILDVVSFAPFLMWNEHNSKYFENIGTINKVALKDNNIYDTTKMHNDDSYADLMKDTFFSLENMDIIQNHIIKTVFYKSNQKLRINKIKTETLIQVMNNIWIKFCRFLPYDLKKQIEDLDIKVSEYLVPLLLKESEFYFNYLRDSDRSKLPPLDRPIMIVKNRKQDLPSFYK